MGSSPFSLELAGRIVRGHQVASGRGPTPYPDGTIAMQTPAFAALGLDLSPYHPATLNVSIAPRRIEILRPDYRFEHVGWTDLHPPETFSFVRCQLLVDEQAHAALIYYPHPETKARHEQAPHVAEVLAPYVGAVRYGQLVRLRVRPEAVRVVEGGV